MNILILGGDSRYLEIIKDLSSKYNVDLVGYRNIYINDTIHNIDIKNLDISKYNIIIFPINGVMDNNLINCHFNSNPIQLPTDILINAQDNVLIFSGINTPNLNNMLKIANKECTFLMNDTCVVKENAIPTVEGIIADIITNTDITINDSKVLVLGYGNIGRVLVEYLNMLGANTSVGIILDKDKELLSKKNINSFYTTNREQLIREINNNDIIINTVPQFIINDDDIKYINPDSYILDISSHPHGINKSMLDKYHIKNKLYLGIPGKIAPKTAGKILIKKINYITEDN